MHDFRNPLLKEGVGNGDSRGSKICDWRLLDFQRAETVFRLVSTKPSFLSLEKLIYSHLKSLLSQAPEHSLPFLISPPPLSHLSPLSLLSQPVSYLLSLSFS